MENNRSFRKDRPHFKNDNFKKDSFKKDGFKKKFEVKTPELRKDGVYNSFERLEAKINFEISQEPKESFDKPKYKKLDTSSNRSRKKKPTKAILRKKLKPEATSSL